MDILGIDGQPMVGLAINVPPPLAKARVDSEENGKSDEETDADKESTPMPPSA